MKPQVNHGARPARRCRFHRPRAYGSPGRDGAAPTGATRPVPTGSARTGAVGRRRRPEPYNGAGGRLRALAPAGGHGSPIHAVRVDRQRAPRGKLIAPGKPFAELPGVEPVDGLAIRRAPVTGSGTRDGPTMTAGELPPPSGELAMAPPTMEHQEPTWRASGRHSSNRAAEPLCWSAPVSGVVRRSRPPFPGSWRASSPPRSAPPSWRGQRVVRTCGLPPPSSSTG